MQLYQKILIGIGLGILAGLLLGPNSRILPQDGVRLSNAQVVSDPAAMDSVPAATGLTDAKIVEERSGDPTWLKLEWRLSPTRLLALRKQDITNVNARETYSGWVRASEATRYSAMGAKLIEYTEWIGRVFLAMIKMVVVPLVFFSLVVGVASLGDLRALGRLGGRVISYFTVTTIIALVIGIGLANLVKPGALISSADRTELLASYSGAVGETVDQAAKAPSFVDQIVSIVPTNPVAALANGDMLAIIFLALMFGVALTMLETQRAQPVVDLFSRINDTVVMLVHIAMLIAPYGVAALMFKVVGTTGLSVLLALAVYALVVLAGLFIHVAATYGSVVHFGAKLPFWRFLGAIKEPLLVAFSTSSSSATLPVSMEACEDNLHCSKKMTSFVLPLGATVNMDGTALYQGVAAVFIAQIYGMDLSIGDQAKIVVSATLASIGAAGVPGAGIVTLAMVLESVGVPVEGIALVIGVDRLLDMFRTTTNVIGDTSATAFMSRLEGDPLRVMTDKEDAADPAHGFEGRLSGGSHPVSVDETD